MNNSVFNDYFLNIDKSHRLQLNRIISVVKESVPEANEVISYGVPGFKYQGQYLLGFAVFKDRLSLFPTPGPIKNLKEKLKDYKTTKGTIQFNAGNPLPVSLIKEIIYNRLEEIKR